MITIIVSRVTRSSDDEVHRDIQTKYSDKTGFSIPHNIIDKLGDKKFKKKNLN